MVLNGQIAKIILVRVVGFLGQIFWTNKIHHTYIPECTLTGSVPHPQNQMHMLSPTSTDVQRSWVEVGGNAECDTRSGEVYLKQSPGKVSSLEACQKSCQNAAGCQSITYFRSGWCSHYSTACTKVKRKPGAIAMRLTAAPKTTRTTPSLCPHKNA